MGLKNVDISELYDLFQERRGCYFVCCDIRGLMQINQISRRAGDLAILEAMNRISGVVGEEDVLFRMGGDEFCVLTNSRERAYAEELAEKIKAGNGKTYSFEEKEISLSLYTAVICPEKKSVNYADLYTGLQDALWNAVQKEKREQ